MELSHHPTVPFSMLRGLLGVAERKGVSQATLLSSAEISADELARAEGRLSRPRFERAAQCAIELTGDPALGLHWAELLMQRGFGPISDGLAHASSLRQAFLLLERFEQFFTNRASVTVAELDDEARVRVAPGTGPLVVRRFLAELSIGWYVRLISMICPGAPVTRVALTYEAPAYHAAYVDLFGPVVHFGQPFTEVGFPHVWLDTPRRAVDPQGGPQQRPSCSEALYHLLRTRAEERMSMPDAARALGFGERSLRRRLTAEGHSFKEIEFRALTEAATAMLVEERRTIHETAHQLGFSGPSAFHRAFKRWTGRTPSHFQTDTQDELPRSARGS